MRLRLIRRLALACLLAGPAAAAPSPIGNWLTEDGSGVIAIAPCGANVCGAIVGMDKPLDANGNPVRDVRGVPMCGLGILQSTTETGPGRYEGLITNPLDGSVWHCVFWVDNNGNLDMRGYVLLPLFGQTQVWTRFAPSLTAGCTIER